MFGINTGFYGMFDFESLVNDFINGGYIDRNGNLKVTSDREDLLIYTANTLVDKTIFKSVTLNYLEYLGFESKNREFELYLEDDYSFKLVIKSKDKCKYNYINETVDLRDYYTFVNWLKKHNYYR